MNTKTFQLVMDSIQTFGPALHSRSLGTPHQEKVFMLPSAPEFWECRECWEHIGHFWSLLKLQLAPGDTWSSSLPRTNIGIHEHPGVGGNIFIFILCFWSDLNHQLHHYRVKASYLITIYTLNTLDYLTTAPLSLPTPTPTFTSI